MGVISEGYWKNSGICLGRIYSQFVMDTLCHCLLFQLPILRWWSFDSKPTLFVVETICRGNRKFILCPIPLKLKLGLELKQKFKTCCRCNSNLTRCLHCRRYQGITLLGSFSRRNYVLSVQGNAGLARLSSLEQHSGRYSSAGYRQPDLVLPSIHP